MDNIRDMELIEYSDQAEKVLSNPIMQSYFLQRKAELFNQFSITGETGDHDRKEIWRTMKEVDALEAHLRAHINNGKIALDRLNGNKSAQSISNLHKR